MEYDRMESLAERQRALEDEAYRCRKRADEFHQGQDTIRFTPDLFAHFAPGRELVLFFSRIGHRAIVARTPTDCIDLAKYLVQAKPCWVESRQPVLLRLLLIFLTSAFTKPNERFDLTTQKFGVSVNPPIEACRVTLQVFSRPITRQNERNLQAQLRAHRGLTELLDDRYGQLIAAIAAAGASALLPTNYPTDARPHVPGFLFRNANTEEMKHAAGRRFTRPIGGGAASVDSDHRADHGYGASTDISKDRGFSPLLDRTIN
jgi:hypothetical protein